MLSEQNSASSPTAHITRPLYLAPEAASSLQRIRRHQAQQSAAGAQDTRSRRPQAAVQGIIASAATLAGSKSQVGVQAANEPTDIDSIYLLDSRGQAIANSASGGPPGQVFPYSDALSLSTGKSLQVSSINGEPIGIFVTTLAPPLPARSCSRNTFHGYLGVATFYSAEHAILNRLIIMMVIATIAIIGVGSAAIFSFTNLLLSPLRHMRDAAQAIAL